MKIKYWIQIICIMAAVGFIAGPATVKSSAQIDPQLERLEVDLWSEWDRPEMLVIYRGTLQADVPVPATLSFRLPPQVNEPHAVAYADEDGSLFDATYSTQSTDAGLIVTLETSSRVFQLEYYDALTYDGDLRSYSYVWPGDYAVDQFDVAFLPPSGATQVQTEPTLDASQQSSGGTVFLGTLGRLAQDQSAQVTISYRGSDATQVVAPPEATQEDSSSFPLIVAAGLVLLLGLVIAGVVWYTRRPKHSSISVGSQTQRPKRGKRRAQSTANKRSPSTAGHCTQCGSALGVDDRFCGQCGAPVKGKS
jgi:hypothetical protein